MASQELATVREHADAVFMEFRAEFIFLAFITAFLGFGGFILFNQGKPDFLVMATHSSVLSVIIVRRLALASRRSLKSEAPAADIELAGRVDSFFRVFRLEIIVCLALLGIALMYYVIQMVKLGRPSIPGITIALIMALTIRRLIISGR